MCWNRSRLCSRSAGVGAILKIKSMTACAQARVEEMMEDERDGCQEIAKPRLFGRSPKFLNFTFLHSSSLTTYTLNMSLLTGLKTGTSRSMLNGSCARNLVFTTVRSQARSASTVQEVQEEYRDYEQRMKKAQQVPTRNNQGRRMSPEHVMRRDIDMNMLVVPSLGKRRLRSPS